jgi:hypothetical protein
MDEGEGEESDHENGEKCQRKEKMDRVPNLSTFNVKGDNRNINDD